jgi:hypothetical protein
MEPILSPWLVYLIFKIDDIIGGFTFTSAIALIFTTVAWIIMYGIWQEDTYSDREVIEKAKKKLFKITKIVISLSLGTLFICDFIPDKKTIIALCVTQSLTQDRVEKIIDTSVDVKETIKKDIIDIIQAIEKETTTKKEGEK